MSHKTAARPLAIPPADDEVLRRDDPRWQRLHDLINEHSLQIGDFILSSGRRSKFLFQLRQTTLFPEAAVLIGEIIIEYMQRLNLKSVGGMETGAIPLVSTISPLSHLKGWPVKAFFIRKKAKEHGARELIDGHVSDGDEVLMVDDVATTGNSMFEGLAGLHTKFPRCYVRKALVVIDRQEGAAEALHARERIQLVSLFKRSDFPNIPAQ